MPWEEAKDGEERRDFKRKFTRRIPGYGWARTAPPQLEPAPAVQP